MLGLAKVFARGKHSTLFFLSINDEDKRKFYKIDAQSQLPFKQTLKDKAPSFFTVRLFLSQQKVSEKKNSKFLFYPSLNFLFLKQNNVT